MADSDYEYDELDHRALHLLNSGHPTEAAELFGELVDRLQAENSDDVRRITELSRLRGHALREAGDLDASTHCLESAIALLRARTRTPAESIILAATQRSVALNYEARERSADTGRARADMLDVVSSLLPSLPDQAAQLVLELAGDLHTAEANWIAPVNWLRSRLSDLDSEAQVLVLLSIQKFASDIAAHELASNVIIDALERIENTDDATLKNLTAISYKLAAAALNLNMAEPAKKLVERLKNLIDTNDPEWGFAIARIEAHLSRDADPKQAIDMHREVLELAVAAWGEQDDRSRMAMLDLGDSLADCNDQVQAAQTYKKLLQIERKVLGDEDPRVADVATALAKSLDSHGDYYQADLAHRLAYSIRKNVHGAVHPDTGQSIIDIAELSRVLDRQDEAEHYFLDALEIERRLSKNDAQTEKGALIRNNLGELYTTQGRFDEARQLIVEAGSIRLRLFGRGSKKAWRSLRSLASLEYARGEIERAIELAKGALSEDPDTAGHWDSARVLAGAQLKKGEFGAAESLFRQLLDAGESSGGRYRPRFLEIVEGLALCHGARGDWEGAADVASKILQIARDELADIVRTSSPTRLARFWRHLTKIQSIWLWALVHGDLVHGELARDAFELVQRTKGLRTRHLTWRKFGPANSEYAAPSGEAEFRQAQDELISVRSELIEELLDYGESVRGPLPQSIRAKRARLQALERSLSSGISNWKLDWEGAFSSADSVLRTIRPGVVTLEIIVVDDVLSERLGKTSAPRYVAFCAGPGSKGDFQLVDLGLAQTLDQAAMDLRSSLVAEPWLEGAPEPAWNRLSRFIGKKILKPLWKTISSASHLVVAPDGALVALPFEILNTPDGELLVDQLKVSYLLRTSDLPQFKEGLSFDSGPLVIAGPDYDLVDAFDAPRRSQIGAESITARSLRWENRFEALPGARLEGKAVGRLLNVEPLLDVWALAPEFLRSPSAEIIHIATHGFCLPMAEGDRYTRLMGGATGNAIDRRAILEDPMQRSGLVMAGINAKLDGRSLPEDVGDALLFASDIQEMDLRRTDMVVLSACRSGLGDLEIGDGAHGLRRAFRAAGCRSVVSTLWDIPEESSRKLVERFYTSLLSGTSRIEALAEARDAVRAEHPFDPIHWAGFVLDGEYGPLARFSGGSDMRVVLATSGQQAIAIISSRSDEDAMGRLAERIDQKGSASVLDLRQLLATEDLSDDIRLLALSDRSDRANRLGDNEQSLADSRAILTLPAISKQSRIQAKFDVARTLQLMERLEEAASEYQELLSEELEVRVRCMVLVNHGILLGQLGRIEDALADFSSVIDMPDAPTDQKFMAYANRSNFGIVKDPNPRRAISDLQAALDLGVADAFEEWKLRLHRVYSRIGLGDQKGALDDLDELEGYPDLSEEWRRELANLRLVVSGVRAPDQLFADLNLSPELDAILKEIENLCKE